MLFAFFFYVIPACLGILVIDDYQSQPNSYINIPKPDHEDRIFETIINLYSPTFSASDKVDVYVTLYPDAVSKKEFLNANRTHSASTGIGLPAKYYMMFQGSICTPTPILEQNRYERTDGCYLELKFDESGMFYRGSKIINYPVSGSYGTFLAEGVPRGIAEDSLQPYKFIHIESLESYLSYRNTKIILIISIIGTYLGALGAYFQWRTSI